MISVVDDDLSVRKALRRLIHTAGYDVTAYESAEDFLSDETASESKCLILDVHLPGMSGLDLQERLLESQRALPVVFISAFSDPNASAQAIRAGAIDFLPKPLDSERLLETIEQALHE